MDTVKKELRKAARRGRDLWRRQQRYIKASSAVLRDLRFARDGGALAKTTAAISIAGTLLDAALPELTLEEDLKQQGYRLMQTSIGGFVCDVIERRGLPVRVITTNTGAVVKIWEYGSSSIAVTYFGDRRDAGPFVRNGGDASLLDMVAEEIWLGKQDLVLEQAKDGASRGIHSYALAPLEEPGAYIGEPGPAYWAERLAHYGVRPRTLLIKGPSGVGKSVLARHIGRLVAGGSARTLKVAGGVLKHISGGELRDIARFLQPSVLLLDDLPALLEDELLASFLDVFEALRVEGCVVIVTTMAYVRTEATAKVYRAEHHVEGMRPGRIDEVVVLPPPRTADRDAILRHYYEVYDLKAPSDAKQKDIVSMTAGLTGAYLEEIVERIKAHNAHDIQAEIVSVLQTAPPAPLVRQKASRLIILGCRPGEKASKRHRRLAKKWESNAAKMRKRGDKLERMAERQSIAAGRAECREKEQEQKKRAREAAKKKAKKAKKAAEKKGKKATRKKSGATA